MATFRLDSKSETEVKILAPPSIEASDVKQFDLLSKDWLQESVKVFILDFSLTEDIPSMFYRSLSQFAQALKLQGSALASVGVRATVQKKITDDGMANVFQLAKSEDDARKRAGIKAAAFNLSAEFLNPFVVSVIQALKIQAKTDVIAKKLEAKADLQKYRCDIAGHMSFRSGDVKGALALCFPKASFVKIYNSMLGESNESLTKDMRDGVAELLNIVYGSAKRELNEKQGFQFQRAIPTVMEGENLIVSHVSTQRVIIVPFASEHGGFWLEIAVD